MRLQHNVYGITVVFIHVNHVEFGIYYQDLAQSSYTCVLMFQ